MSTPDDDLVKELFARFGFAYYESECLHRGLCNAYVLAPFETPGHVTAPRVDERMAEAFDMTLGQVVEALRPWTPPTFHEQLAEAVDIRNHLAHRFWFERIHLGMTEDGVHGLIAELIGEKTTPSSRTCLRVRTPARALRVHGTTNLASRTEPASRPVEHKTAKSLRLAS